MNQLNQMTALLYLDRPSGSTEWIIVPFYSWDELYSKISGHQQDYLLCGKVGLECVLGCPLPVSHNQRGT